MIISAMNANPKTAIVIVNWNKKTDTLNLLNSLKTLNYNNYKILVVDNSSSDGSVEAIKNQFPHAELLVNSENLGGTGGFNSGIRRVLKEGGYKYIWLLDNDAEVEDNSLNELIIAMEHDDDIGLAGSRIVDARRRDITVEAGALIESEMIGVRPLYRNVTNLKLDTQTADVDYVAVCSAIVRTSALEKVGLMDERYFIFWDDMDWGLIFKRNGFKVVCAVNSVAYHEAFTEKRGLLVDYYYGNRNSLLTYSKHSGLWKRIPLFYKYLRRKCTSLVLLGFNGDPDLMALGFSGIFDFILGSWGKKDAPSGDRPLKSPGALPDRAGKILILNDGSRDEIYGALNNLKTKYPEASFTILINEDRKDYFRDDFDNLIEIDTGRPYSLIYHAGIFLDLLKKNFTLSVSFKNASPLSYATKKSYVFDSGTGNFYETGNNLWNIWKPVLSTILGEIMSLVLLPFIYVSSLQYRKNKCKSIPK